MIIKAKRKMKLPKKLIELFHNNSVHFAVAVDDETCHRLNELGFSPELGAGETVLPDASFGPVARFNAEGKEDPDPTKPVETAWYQKEWSWTEHHGPYPVEQSKIVDYPVKRRPRIFTPPPSVEMTIVANDEGEKFAILPLTTLGTEDSDLSLHKLNLMLEIFGECTILSENFDVASLPEIKTMNWEILPPGNQIWEDLKPQVTQVLDAAKNDQDKVVSEHRFKIINEYNPPIVAVGRAGFSGYLVFGFPDKEIYVCESVFKNNATYVFDENWEELSKRTKQEVLNEDLQMERIIHRDGWENRIKDLLE